MRTAALVGIGGILVMTGCHTCHCVVIIGCLGSVAADLENLAPSDHPECGDWSAMIIVRLCTEGTGWLCAELLPALIATDWTSWTFDVVLSGVTCPSEGAPN